MRQSLGMSQQLNIIIIFILVVFALLAASLSYYKAFRVNNVIVDSIEKYEGYNDFAKKKINNDLGGIGYQKLNSNCGENNLSENGSGYCVYLNESVKNKNNVKSYSYKVTTYMYIDLPLMNLIRIPVNSSTMQIACIGSNNDCKKL